MRFGLDLGGTKISGIRMTPDGRVAARTRRPSPRGNYAATLAALAETVAALDGDAYPDAPVGLGIPGALSPRTGLVKNANSTWLIGERIDRDASAALNRPVRVANDADCFTLSEAVDGAGVGHDSVFGVILGTGVGGGVAVNARLLRGPNAIAGEWGHNPLPWPEPAEVQAAMPCYCGKSGCIETYLSGPGLVAHHAARTGERVSAETIAAAETPARAESLRLYADRLARALAHVVNILDPGAIVLGGGLSGIEALYETVPRLWGRYVFSDTVETALLRNRHGADGGVRGAAWLWSPDEVPSR